MLFSLYGMKCRVRTVPRVGNCIHIIEYILSREYIIIRVCTLCTDMNGQAIVYAFTTRAPLEYTS